MRIISRDILVALASGVALLTATAAGATELKGDGVERTAFPGPYKLTATQLDMISAGQISAGGVGRAAFDFAVTRLYSTVGTVVGTAIGGAPGGVLGGIAGHDIGGLVADTLATQGPAAVELFLYGVPNYDVSILPDTTPSTTPNTSTTTTQTTAPASTSPSTTTSPTFYPLGGQVTAR